MKKNILLVGEIYSDNLGDAVLCQIVKRIIEENISCNIELCDLSGRQFYDRNFNYNFLEKVIIKFMMLLYKLKLKNLGEINTIFKNRYYKQFDKHYDLVVFAGGQIFMDYFVPSIEKLLHIFENNNSPVIFHACGAKEIYDIKLRNRLINILSSKVIKSISIRDDIDLITNYYLSKSNIKAIKTFDTALNAKPYLVDKKIIGKPIIGLGVIYCEEIDNEKQIWFWMKIIDELNIRDIKWQLFCNGNKADYKIMEIIAERKRINKNIYLQDKPKTAEDLVNNIATFKKIISFRLHSHIIAASLDIPSIGISWEKKVQQFFNNIQLSNRCVTINTPVKDIINLLECINSNNSIIKNQAKRSKDLLIKSINEFL